MYVSLFPRDMFADMGRLQRQLQQSFDTTTPAIRGLARGYPALNIGHTPNSVEIYAFAPGIDPAKLELTLDRGVLTITGERAPTLPAGDAKTTVHINERFDGRFRRVVSMPDDIDPNAITAECRDGIVHVSAKRRESTLPRRIEVQ